MRPPDGKWGSQEANGSWNGMVGMLHRGEVDMALGPLGITRARCMCWRSNPVRDLTYFLTAAEPSVPRTVRVVLLVVGGEQFIRV